MLEVEIGKSDSIVMSNLLLLETVFNEFYLGSQITARISRNVIITTILYFLNYIIEMVIKSKRNQQRFYRILHLV